MSKGGPSKPKGDAAWQRLEYEREKRQSMSGLALAAREGDREAAIAMLKYAAHHVWESDMPEPLRMYLADCFEDAIEQESTEFAFNLKMKGRRGHKNDQYKREFRDSQIAKAAEFLHDKGLSYTEAYNLIAEQGEMFEDDRRLTVSSIKAAHLRFYPEAEKDN